MSFYIKRARRFFPLLILLLTIAAIGLCTTFFSINRTEDEKFEAFTDKLFKAELSDNTLTLHYTLASPKNFGISQTQTSLGRISTDKASYYTQCEEYENTLNQFQYSELSEQNQLTLDTLLLYFHTARSLGDNYLLEEYLSPSLGIQAQLPVLLAEYTFRTQQDIIDYFKLLQDIKPYFQSILDFEKVKSEAGFFMNDESLNRLQEQCRSFIQNPDSNYMLQVFSDKLDTFSSISAEEKKELLTLHKKLLKNEVIPAYENLISGLEALRGTGKNSGGLSNFSGGQNYYLYLLQSNCGIYTTIPTLEYRLTRQLLNDCQRINSLLEKNPALLNDYQNLEDTSSAQPEQMLRTLLEYIRQDFPEPAATDYAISYVHESMEEYLSPAFYLTPPLDTGSPNNIYLNRSRLPSSLDLFTTLAHEGFPGHLYQTTYFSAQNPLPIRALFSCSGYVEGWATYVESYAYQYAADYFDCDANLTTLAQLNRNVNLCLYSLLDIGIHYHSWTQAQAGTFLANFGITNDAVLHDIYLYIVENPANYLQYYVSYLNFMDLKSAQQKALGNAFDLQTFHKKILEIGPVPFPILAKYIN